MLSSLEPIVNYRMTFMSELGTRLGEVLARARMSQSALAHRIGASPSFVSAVVRGLKIPGAEFLLSVKRELGVTIDWLLAGEGAPYAAPVDIELARGLLTKTELVPLAVQENQPAARALLRALVPTANLGMPEVGQEAGVDELLANLTRRNEEFVAALSIYNQIVHVPKGEWDRAIARILEGLVHEKSPPRIHGELMSLATAAQRPPPASTAEINWDARVEAKASPASEPATREAPRKRRARKKPASSRA